jgi:hypothetical protein
MTLIDFVHKPSFLIRIKAEKTEKVTPNSLKELQFDFSPEQIF